MKNYGEEFRNSSMIKIELNNRIEINNSSGDYHSAEGMEKMGLNLENSEETIIAKSR